MATTLVSSQKDEKKKKKKQQMEKKRVINIEKKFSERKYTECFGENEE